MAHQITDRDGVFAVREPMWHGLGHVLDEYPTREEVQKLVHPWEPVSEPIYRRTPEMDEDGSVRYVYSQIQGSVLNARSDDGSELAVVSDTFTTVPNNEMYEIASVIEGQDPGSVKYETGGTLDGGRKVWLMIRLKDPIEVNGDPNGLTIPYFAIQNSHDGSGAFRGQAILDRIVCANTSHAADVSSEEMGTSFTFSHTKNVQGRVDEAKTALAGWRQSIHNYKEASEELIKLRISNEQRDAFVERFIPMPASHILTERSAENVIRDQGTLKKILVSQTCEDINRTAYGLVQAAIEYNAFFRQARGEESRFKRTYLKRSKVITDAVKLAREAASA